MIRFSVLFLLILMPYYLMAANTLTVNGGGSGKNTLTVNGPIQTKNKIAFSPVQITSNYTIVSTNSVIGASCTATTPITITLPSAASNKGMEVIISKVDISTQFVTINAAGTDTIGVATDTITLYAPGASLHIESDGNSNWNAPYGLPLNLSYAGLLADDNVASAAPSVNGANCTIQQVPYYVAVSSLDFVVSTTSNVGHVDLGIYDINGQRLASSGSQQRLNAANRQGLSLSHTVYLYPGSYAFCLAADNATASFTKMTTLGAGFSMNFTNSFPLPATLAINSSQTAAQNAIKILAPTMSGQPINPF